MLDSSSKKEYRCYNSISRKLLVSCGVSFLEHQPFYPNASLYGRQPVKTIIWTLCCTFYFYHSNNKILQILHKKTIQGGESHNQKKYKRDTGLFRRPEEPQQCQLLDPAEFSIHVDNVAPFDGLEIPIAMRKGVRSCIQHMITNHPTYTMLSTQYRAYHKIDSIEILKDIHSVLQYRHWKVAVLEETYALSGNDTWEIVDLPKDQRTVGCWWVYTLNYKSDGTIEGYKVRLVAKLLSDFQQRLW